MPRPCRDQHPPSPQTCRLCWCLALPGEQGEKYRRKWGEDAGLATMEIPESKPAAARLSWRYGVTTVPQRRRDLLPRTLASLRGAGFGTPRLFVDGDGDAPSWRKEFDLPVTCREPRVGTAASWHLAALELYHREPAADRYAIFQDDMVCSRNLLAYLEAVKYPPKGYLNLYTFPSNQTLSKGQVGWFPSNQLGRGAVALVFDREAMTALLGDSHLVLRAQNPHRGHKAIDGGIVESMKRLGFTEYVHDPSLVQHTGDTSVMGNNPHPRAPSFRGEDFDLMCLLAPAPTAAGGGLGDVVSKALSVAGVTEEKVTAWLGRPCGCGERRQKLNALGAFARRVLSGMTDRAREHLDAIMGG